MRPRRPFNRLFDIASSTPSTATETPGDEPTPAGDEPTPAAGASAGLSGWRRTAAFLIAAALGVSAAVPIVRETHLQVYLRSEVYVAPMRGTRQQQQRQDQSFKRRDRLMDLAALALAGATLAGAFGVAAGLCGPGPGAGRGGRLGLSRGRRVARGALAGVAAGAAAGAAAAGVAFVLLRSYNLANWGDSLGDALLIRAMASFAVQMGLIGAACGCAVRLAVGKPPKWSFAGATRGPVVAGAAAGVVSGLLLPFVGVIVGSFVAGVLNARGFVRPVPLGLAGQGLLLAGFGTLVAIALARVSGRPDERPDAPPSAP